MAKSSEARLTDDNAGAQAPARAKAPVRGPNARQANAEAALTRDGMNETPRNDGHDSIDNEDERDRHQVRDMTDEEFLALFSGAQNQSVLPDLPKIQGFHTFWATTTNPRDPIAGRLRLGYRFIKQEELPGWEQGVSIKTGEYAGCVGINEMIAMKIPEHRYQLMMQELHHRAPMAEEEKIRALVESHTENALRDKGRIVDEDGFSDHIVQKASVPRFA